jgi:hypothetical protein
MKILFAKLFFALLFLLPMSCFADMIGCKTKYEEEFKFQNTKEFAEYIFYYSRFNGDSSKVIDGKEFGFVTTHPESIHFFAQNIKTGVFTSAVEIDGSENETVLITIEKIENDSIYFKTNLEETKSSAFHNSPISPPTKLLLLISFCGLFIYCCSLFYRKPLLKEN